MEVLWFLNSRFYATTEYAYEFVRSRMPPSGEGNVMRFDRHFLRKAKIDWTSQLRQECHECRTVAPSFLTSTRTQFVELITKALRSQGQVAIRRA
jgi:hypothetical protein